MVEQVKGRGKLYHHYRYGDKTGNKVLLFVFRKFAQVNLPKERVMHNLHKPAKTRHKKTRYQVYDKYDFYGEYLCHLNLSFIALTYPNCYQSRSSVLLIL